MSNGTLIGLLFSTPNNRVISFRGHFHDSGEIMSGDDVTGKYIIRFYCDNGKKVVADEAVDFPFEFNDTEWVFRRPSDYRCN